MLQILVFLSIILVKFENALTLQDSWNNNLEWNEYLAFPLITRCLHFGVTFIRDVVCSTIIDLFNKSYTYRFTYFRMDKHLT